MKNLSKYFILLVIALRLSVQCFAIEQNLKIAYNPSHASNNYYVQPGGVYVAPNGIFVMFNGELTQVNMICTDARGVFVPGIEMSRQFVWCPICEHWYDPDQPHRCK